MSGHRKYIGAHITLGIGESRRDLPRDQRLEILLPNGVPDVLERRRHQTRFECAGSTSPPRPTAAALHGVLPISPNAYVRTGPDAVAKLYRRCDFPGPSPTERLSCQGRSGTVPCTRQLAHSARSHRSEYL